MFEAACVMFSGHAALAQQSGLLGVTLRSFSSLLFSSSSSQTDLCPQKKFSGVWQCGLDADRRPFLGGLPHRVSGSMFSFISSRVFSGHKEQNDTATFHLSGGSTGCSD